jgi:hypothetical protein
LIYQLQTEYIPKWRYRFDSRRFADSLEHLRSIYKDSIKNALKSKKIEVREVVKTQRIKSKQTPASFMKWLAIFAIILFAWFISWKIHKYIAING